MKTYTFTREQLTNLLHFAMATFAKQDGVFDFSPDNQGKPDAIKAVMATLDNDIPFDGSAVAYETDDNISINELGLEAM